MHRGTETERYGSVETRRHGYIEVLRRGNKETWYYLPLKLA